jgi:hypothetical protein
VHKNFQSGKLEERDHLVDQAVDEKVILKWILRNSERVHWIYLSEDKVLPLEFVNTVMNLQFP